MAFERRTLGRTDLFVSSFGIGGGYRIDGNSIEWAFEHGMNYFFWASWAPTYRAMERRLKRLLPRHRDEIVIATAAYSWLFPGSIERAVRKHLRRLKIDQIDLFLLGWVMRESQHRAVDELVRIKDQGLVRYVGFSGHKRPKSFTWRRDGLSLMSSWYVTTPLTGAQNMTSSAIWMKQIGKGLWHLMF